MSHTPNCMGNSEETGSGDVRPKESSLLDIASGDDRHMERLQAAAECLMYLQGDQNNHQQNSGPDVFRSHQADSVRNLDRDFNPGPMMGNNKRPRVMPDQFNGSGSWTEFISHFEICADLNEWNNRQKAQYLSVSLRGAACQLLRTLTPLKRQNYRELVNALSRRFNPENQTELFRAELRNFQRKGSQSLPELAQEIRRLVQLAYPTATPDVMDVLGRDSFIDALDDSDLRWRVYQVKAKSLDDAVCAAVEMEAYKKAERQRAQGRKNLRQLDKFQPGNGTYGSNHEPANLHQMQKQIDSLREMLQKIHPRQENRKPMTHRQNRKDVECWNCGEMGHYKNECSKTRQYPKPRNVSN